MKAAGFSVIIVDDEPLAREGIRMLLQGDPEIADIHECPDGRSATQLIETQRPDLVFLDVQMPEVSGFDVIRAIGPEHMPATVLVTAFDKYAVEAFEVHALDYLLKPYTRRRFATVLHRAKEHVRDRANRDAMPGVVEALRRSTGTAYLKRIAFKARGRTSFLCLNQVDWFGTEGNYIRVHWGQSSALISATMQDLEQRLDPEMFIRIHRCRIVNVSRIKEVQSLLGSVYEIVLQNDVSLASGPAFRKNIETLLRNNI